MKVRFVLSATLLLFPLFAHPAKRCSLLFSELLIPLTSPLLQQIVEKPLLHLGKRFLETGAHRSFGTPFKVVPKSELPEHLQTAMEDVQILARNERLREKVFGNAKSMRLYTSGLKSAPLRLKSLDNKSWSPTVEVGVEVFTLTTGEQIYFYLTSNYRSAIDADYAHLVDLVSEIRESGKSVASLDSFHTHPYDLLPTIMDQDYFNSQLTLVRKAHPELDLRAWKMRTTMENEPVVHEVDLVDWL